MKTPGRQCFQPDGRQSQAGSDPFVQKLAATPPRPKQCSLGNFCSKSDFKCASLKTFVRQVGQLLLFNVMDILVAIGGAIFAVSMLINAALAPCWFATFALFLTVYTVVQFVASIEPRVLRYLGYLLLVALLVLSFFNLYTAILPSCVYCGACTGLTLFFFCGCAVHGLVKKDVQLANFVEPTISSNSTTTTLDPDQCANRFTFLELFNELEFVSPHITLTRRVWSLVFYYAVPKVMVGSASALVVVVVAIEPIIAICTLGNDPFVGSWVDVHNRPWVYIVVLLLLWMVGVFGLFVVAKVSNKLTFFVCGEWRCEQTATDRQDEDDIEATTPSTPTQEPTATNYSLV